MTDIEAGNLNFDMIRSALVDIVNGSAGEVEEAYDFLCEHLPRDLRVVDYDSGWIHIASSDISDEAFEADQSDLGRIECMDDIDLFMSWLLEHDDFQDVIPMNQTA